MNMRPLRFFAAIVDQGGISKAAERLNISQPALSAALKTLEQELGVSLFERRIGRRGLRLTPAGQKFYLRVVEILSTYDSAKAELRDMPLPRERLRIGVIETLAPSALEIASGALRKIQEGRRVELWEGAVSQIAGWLSQGRIDVAWTLVEEGEPNTQVLWKEPVVLAVAPDSPLVSGSNDSIDLSQLGRYPFVLRSRCEMAATAQTFLRGSGVTLQIAWRIERDEIAFSLVEREGGITLAPRSLIPKDLIAVAVDGLRLTRVIGLRWREQVAPEDLCVLSEVLRVSHRRGSVL